MIAMRRDKEQLTVYPTRRLAKLVKERAKINRRSVSETTIEILEAFFNPGGAQSG
jgi:hypothetical protein